MLRKVNTVLISVSDKTGIEPFARFLAESGVAVISTGGTAKLLKEKGIKVTDISEHTGFPEIMDGRVKTLHPKVHGGILARRSDTAHVAAMQEHNITGIDMVVVNLYPFEQTVKGGADYQECIENIDIGGPGMIRAAAKNHEDVAIIVHPEDYSLVMEEMKQHHGATSFDVRKKLAAKAYARTASYDAAISRWFCEHLQEPFPETLTFSAQRKMVLRYGENPHQQAALYTDSTFSEGIAHAEQLQGKELSYNNINDTDAAYELVGEFSQPACAIIKHANPCGVAQAENITEAYKRALSCDPVSAYGGIIAFNREVDGSTAACFAKMFAEVIIAPSFDKKALDIFGAKKNLRLLQTGSIPAPERRQMLIKPVSGGYLLQDRDYTILPQEALKVVTQRTPTEKEMEDLLFAFTICKHVKSNAIVLAKDCVTTGVGAGQMSRIDSMRVAAWKAKETAEHVESAAGSVLASDAFFPFDDGVLAAADAGITAIIQPGGSIRDAEVIAAADKHHIAMVFTGMRHFRH